MRQLPQQKRANCHNENVPTATTKTRQLPQRKCANCHNRRKDSNVLVNKFFTLCSSLNKLFPSNGASLFYLFTLLPFYL